MTINELLALAGLTASDEIPVWDAEGQVNGRTKKITAQNLAASIKTIASLIASSDLDTTPTSGSTKAVQSGGVYDAIQQSTATVAAASSTIASGGVQFFKCGRVVTAVIGSIDSQTVAAWGSVDICSIPDGFTPVTNPSTQVPRQGQTTAIPVFARYVNGKLALQNQSNASVTTGAIMPFVHIYTV